MLNNLLIAAILTGLLYAYNTNTGTVIDNTQYTVAFVGFAVGVALIYKFLMPAGTAAPNLVQMVGLQKMLDNGPNGEQEVPCYNVPYHVVSTQYGDKAVLAGYNENVKAYHTGAAGKFEEPYRAGDRKIDEECLRVGYHEKNLPPSM